MSITLRNIAHFKSGVYAKPEYHQDTLYLQASDFDEYGDILQGLRPVLSSEGKYQRNLLQDGDVLFSAKGIHNFGVVYKESFGYAVASSTFIVIRLKGMEKVNPEYLAWFLTHTSQIKRLHSRQLGTTIPSISIRELSELNVEMPSLEVQHHVLQIQKLRNEQKQLAQELENARAAKIKYLLTKAITTKQ